MAGVTPPPITSDRVQPTRVQLQRLGLVALAAAGYVVVFYFGAPLVGGSLATISLLVVGLVGWWFGRWVGMLAGALAWPVNVWLYTDTPGVVDVHPIIHLLNGAVAIFAGWVVSRLHDWIEHIHNQAEALRRERLRLEEETTRREFVEASLEAERDFARQVINSLGQGLVLMDRNWRFTFVNPAYAAIVGRSPEEILGKTPLDLAPESEHAAMLESRDRRERGEQHTYEAKLHAVDGRAIDTLVTVTPRIVDGEINGSIVLVTDVSAQKQTEAELRRSQAELRRQAMFLTQTQSTAEVGGWEFDLDTGQLVWTTEMHRLMGTDPATFIPEQGAAMSVYAPEYDAKMASQILESVQTAKGWDTEIQFVRADGERRWARSVGQVATKDGAPNKVYGSFQDITARKMDEAKLRAAEEEYRTLFENTPIGLYRSSIDGRQLRCNPALVRLNGYETEAEQIAAVGDISTEWYVDPGRRAEFTRLLFETGRIESFESEIYRHKTRERIWINETARLVRDAAGQPIYFEGTVEDISQRKRAEQALADERHFALQVMENMGQGLTVTDRDARFVYVNPAYARMVGEVPERLLGRSPFEVTAIDDQSMLEVNRLRRLRGEKSTYETRLIRNDGTELYALITGVPRYEQGEYAGAIATVTDLTERRMQEQRLQTLNAELEGKNREMETFTYSVSHDLKAPLRGIDGYSRLLLEEYGPQLDDEGRRFLTTIRSATVQMNQLIQDLLAYSRLERRALSRARVGLGELVATILHEKRLDIEERGAAVTVAIGNLTAVGDRDGIAQAVRNLIDNALKFTRAAASPRVEIVAQQTGPTTVLSVKDNGIGFDMQYHDRLFGIFQRLHRAEDYAGTGVGLALVRKAMDRMGGRVWAESAPGHGATFYLAMPNGGDPLGADSEHKLLAGGAGVSAQGE
jgi:PAS domain S-box-containing protein